METQSNADPLHGITLKAMLTELENRLHWEVLAELTRINCFMENPSIESSLKFLRKTPWARVKIERLYIETFLSTEKRIKTPTTLPKKEEEENHGIRR